ncbi:hypothetical protein MOQ_006435 [Trypanosoma cruzi marinkellei]|uniref:Seipin n=1 Tax=Trypanosoma cruzi marinkellei TaxID=85056 RepID=K2M464_TRYCR|nr:hypothetical protein MOQ_006435 [Trypanosoma cruzi marinkellei]
MDELFVFLFDCGVSCKEYLAGRIHDSRELFDVWRQIALRIFKNTFFASIAIFLLLLVVVFTLLGCVVFSLVGSMTIRHYILSHAPGNQLMSLTFNTMPFETEPWRLRKVDAIVSYLTPQPEALLPRSDDDTLVAATKETTDRQLTSSVVGQAASLKMSIIEQYVKNTLATSTLIIPSLAQKDVFPPGGGVSIEALFEQKKPMFNAKGVYDAKMQIVFLKEDVGRDISMVLESSVLFAEDPDIPQTLATLDVLLKTTTSFTVTTGAKESHVFMQLIKMLLRFVFFVPLWMYETLFFSLRYDVFPGIDPSTEVAVISDVYTGFEPPLVLQPRLRAINFTLYQQGGHVMNRARLIRMHFFTSVQLTGLAYYFSAYKWISFIFMTVMLFICVCAIAMGLVFVAGVLIASHYLRDGNSIAQHDDNDDDKKRPLSEEEEDEKGMDLIEEKDLLSSHRSESTFLHDEDWASTLRGSRQESLFHLYEANLPLTKEKKSK